MTTRFDIPLALRRLSGMLGGTSSQVSREDVRRRVLEEMLHAGFERARFYERCGDLAFRQHPILLLVTEAARNPDADMLAHVGYGISATDGGLGYGVLDRAPVVVADVSDFAGEFPEWALDLDLLDRPWVDIWLRAGGEDLGTLAADWQGSKTDISRDQRNLLECLGLIVAAHLQLRPQHRVHQLREALPDAAPEAPDGTATTPEAVMVAAAREIGAIMDARLVAVFEYHWSSGRLKKCCELDETRLSSKQRILTGDEEYEAGQHLTGKAWIDPTYRHIPLFEQVPQLAGLIEPRSLRRHIEYMDQAPHTSLYGRVDELEPRFMLRLMNRVSSQVPFVGERTMLDELLAELRSQLNRAIAIDRTNCLESATKSSAQSLDPQNVVKELAPLLVREGVTNFLVLCHRPPSTQFNFGATSGDELVGLDVKTGGEWKSTRLYARALNNDKPMLLELATAERAGDRLAQELRQRQFQSVLTFPMTAGETRGVLLVPLALGTPVRRNNFVQQCGAGRLSLLSAYARLLGDSVDTAVATAKADGARHALGLLGHELSTPLARLGSTAEGALREIHKMVTQTQRLHESGKPELALDMLDDIRGAASGYLERVTMERRNVGAATRLAPIVAQEADGSLELQFESFDVGQLVLEAVSQAEEESNSDPANIDVERNQRHVFRFRAKTSVASLGRAVGDAGLLTLALINILRNAAKYSMTRPGRSTVEVEIVGQPQRGMKIILIRNIGRSLVPEQMELIFEPWVRLLDTDGIVARRGMGLGLFLSRRIAYAHGGTVLCRRSRPIEETDRAPVVADELERMLIALPRHRSRRHGLTSLPGDSALAPGHGAMPQRYLTEFELRIRDDLVVGPQVHRWRTRSSVGTIRSRAHN